MRNVFRFFAAVLATGLLSGTASAAPLVYLEVLGSSTGAAGSYSSNLQVSAGKTYYYEVLVMPAAVGTKNVQGSLTRTINSLGATDGANSLSFNVNNTAGNSIPVAFAQPTLSTAWQGGLSQSSGTLTSGDTGINAVRPIQSPGVFSGPNAAVVMAGTFMTPGTLAKGLTSAISLSWGSSNGGFHINNGTTTFLANPTIEAGSDPFVGFEGLTLKTAAAAVATPEPSSVIMMGLGVVGVAGLAAARRRRTV